MSGLYKEKLVLVNHKTNEQMEISRCSVQGDKIFTKTVNIPIQVNDNLIRKLPNGVVETYIVKRADMSGVGTSLCHYEINAQKQ